MRASAARAQPTASLWQRCALRALAAAAALRTVRERSALIIVEPRARVSASERELSFLRCFSSFSRSFYPPLRGRLASPSFLPPKSISISLHAFALLLLLLLCRSLLLCRTHIFFSLVARVSTHNFIFTHARAYRVPFFVLSVLLFCVFGSRSLFLLPIHYTDSGIPCAATKAHTHDKIYFSMQI